jgi:hypothetical protein
MMPVIFYSMLRRLRVDFGVGAYSLLASIFLSVILVLGLYMPGGDLAILLAYI